MVKQVVYMYISHLHVLCGAYTCTSSVSVIIDHITGLNLYNFYVERCTAIGRTSFHLTIVGDVATLIRRESPIRTLADDSGICCMQAINDRPNLSIMDQTCIVYMVRVYIFSTTPPFK